MTSIKKNVHEGKTKRIALQIDSKALVVSDHAYPIPQRPDSDGQSKYDANVSRVAIACDVPEFCGESPDVVHCVAHTDKATRSEDFMRNFFDGTAANKKVIILHVANEPLKDECPSKKLEIKDGPTFYWLSMKDRSSYERESEKWLGEFLKLTPEQAEELLKSGDRSDVPIAIENQSARFLDIILPACIENRLAFRLLCEAAKVVAEENTRRSAKGEQTSNTVELSGIIIHAPKDLGEWLAPFGKSESEEIPQVAGMIGSGDVKTAAENVLKAVNEDGNLSEAITKFLNPSVIQNS
ncbi:MAG: hypothetical protein IH623_10245 [Verrucomicrobia bacterium]|nr:hypothetical protein [Verrucomicrobiota bacterium]